MLHSNVLGAFSVVSLILTSSQCVFNRHFACVSFAKEIFHIVIIDALSKIEIVPQILVFFVCCCFVFVFEYLAKIKRMHNNVSLLDCFFSYYKVLSLYIFCEPVNRANEFKTANELR